MNLTDQTLVCALGPSDRAVSAWNSLNRDIAFDDLPHVVIRAMPQIYLNLKGQSRVTELPRLKGVYRSSWSSNAMRFAGARDFFSACNTHQIQYRVIKGGALSAFTGNWGMRRMGDLDVVISPSGEQPTLHALSALGYAQKLAQGDGLSSQTDTSLMEGVWENKTGAVLDLHTTHGRPHLFTQLFEQSGNLRTITNTQILVPPLELTLAVAIWHGRKATAGTDQIQTLLDIGTLLQQANMATLRQILIRSDLLSPANDYINHLEDLDLIPAHLRKDWNRNSARDLYVLATAKAEKVQRNTVKLATFPSIVTRRKLSPGQKKSLRVNKGLRARSYQLWSNLGQLRPVEEWVCKHAGGFHTPTEGGPIPDRDYRVRIPATAHKPARLKLTVDFDSSHNTTPSRAVYINGTTQGFVPFPENAPGIYEFTPESNFIEVSLRTFGDSMHAPVQKCSLEWT